MKTHPPVHWKTNKPPLFFYLIYFPAPVLVLWFFLISSAPARSCYCHEAHATAREANASRRLGNPAKGPLKSPVHCDNMVRMGLRSPSIWGPIMPRGVSFSVGDDKNCSLSHAPNHDTHPQGRQPSAGVFIGALPNKYITLNEKKITLNEGKIHHLDTNIIVLCYVASIVPGSIVVADRMHPNNCLCVSVIIGEMYHYKNAT